MTTSKKYKNKQKRKTKSRRRKGGNNIEEGNIDDLINETINLQRKFNDLNTEINEKLNKKSAQINETRNINSSNDTFKTKSDNLENNNNNINKAVETNVKLLPQAEEGGEPREGNTVTVKIYPNNTPGSSELTLGDYRVKINKKLPSDIDSAEYFLTNTIKYIKNHVDKYKNRKTELDTNIFPNTKFKYVYMPSAKNE